MQRQSEEIADNGHYKTNYQEYVDEQQFTKIDLRQKVMDINKHPYNTIGKISSKKQYIHQGIKKQAQKIGVGCLIHPKIVLTVAHVIYFGTLGIHSGIAENIQFLHLNKGKTMKVKQCKFNQKYLSKKNFDTQIYDVAVLILEEEAEIKENQVMIMDDSHHFSDTQLEIITVLTIQKNAQSNELNLYEQKNTIQKVDTSKIFYRHTTKSGDSGGPILISFNNDHLLIGLHKACSFKANFGLIVQALLKQNQFLEEIRKHYKIKTKKQLTQMNKTVISLVIKKKDQPKIIPNVIEQQTIVSQDKNTFQKVLKDPNQYLQIHKDYVFSHSKNRQGKVLVLWLPYSGAKLDVKEFYQYDWSKLEEIQLKSCLNTNENMKLFFSGTSIFNSLKTLQIGRMDNEFGYSGMSEFIKYVCLGHFQSLTRIDFHYLSLGDQSLLLFTQNIQRFSLLQRLSLHGNKFGVEGIKGFTLKGHILSKLQSLSLSQCGLGFQEIKALSQNAQNWKSVIRLYLQYNKMGDESLRMLSFHAHKFENLTQIFMRENSFSDEGWKALVENAHNFTNLKRIDICSSKIKQINQGDLEQFLNVIQIDFGWFDFNKSDLSQQSIRVLNKYKKQHQRNGIEVRYHQPQGWIQKTIKYVGSFF